MSSPLKQLLPKPRHHRSKNRPTSSIKTLRHFVSKAWNGIRLFMKAVWASPPLVRVLILLPLIALFWLSINWAIHTFNKPSEMLFPLDYSLNKHPIETWKEYEPLFREHATTTITPEFLAALAQVESGGNPAARTYWRWKMTWNPFEWYQPASSAVGMFQITDGTFQKAKHYCIHHNTVVEDGPWHDLNTCWFNNLYIRVLPSHAIELTSAWLDQLVTKTIRDQRIDKISLQRKQDLAAIIHLCGARAGRAFAARKLQLTSHQRCGDHDVRAYLARINALKSRFTKSSPREKPIWKAN